MLEVEVKYRCDVKSLRDRLLSRGFSFSGAGEEVDVYFQHPCRNFVETDEALRVRITDSHVTVTYKGPRIGVGAKTREEISMSVGGDVLELFRRLGFVEVARVKKRREYYKRGDVSISLDVVEGLGEFVEIEKVVYDHGEVSKAVEELRSLGAELGLVEEVRETYLELILKVLKPS
ncbi:MAG: class IV adenylate cyclase [Pyrobaculum sp.]